MFKIRCKLQINRPYISDQTINSRLRRHQSTIYHVWVVNVNDWNILLSDFDNLSLAGEGFNYPEKIGSFSQTVSRLRLSSNAREKAIGMLRSGMSEAMVSRHFDVPRSSVSWLQTRYAQTGERLDRPRPRQPRVTALHRIAALEWGIYVTYFWQRLKLHRRP